MDQREPYDSSRSQQSGDENASRKKSQKQYRHSYEGEKLPGDPLAITLGIVSLVFFFIFCSCYGIIAVITLIISIIGLITANKNIRLYHAEPERYSYNTFRSVENARIINIVGVVLSGLVTAILIFLLLFFGSIFYAIIDGDWENLKHLDTFNEEIYEDDTFRVEEQSDTWEYGEEIDTLSQRTDSLDLQIDPADSITEDTIN
jgi:hypothetical protein